MSKTKQEITQDELDDLRPMIISAKKRLKNTVDEINIINWPKNFETRYERELAIKLLSYVDYFDDREIIEAYDYCLRNVIENIEGDKKILILPVGEYGKSGTAMIYFLCKTDVYNENEGRFKLISHHRQLKGKLTDDVSLVLVDDFFGSGHSAVKFYNHAIEQQIRRLRVKPAVFFVSVISLNDAERYLFKKIPGCVLYSANYRDKAFSKRSTPFGRRKIEIRELCYRYGSKLNRDNPLGYNNSQALITFSYGAPNNSLPIFWSSIGKWVPIFPRFFEDKKNQARAFRKETAHWLSMMRHLNPIRFEDFASGVGDLGWKTFRFVKKTDFQLFSFIRLSKSKKPKHVICQMLGIKNEDYNMILHKSIEKGITDENGVLTEFGENAYYEVTGDIRRFNRTTRSNSESTQSFYVPKSFRGKK